MAAEKSHLARPSQELFRKSTIENIYYTMVVPVFLLFCTVLSFTWGPKCILCVWTVIYQEFCEILCRVLVLVLLYLVSCIFFYGLFTFYVRLSLSLAYLSLSLSFQFLVPASLHYYIQYFLNLRKRQGKWQLFIKKKQNMLLKKEDKVIESHWPYLVW